MSRRNKLFFWTAEILLLTLIFYLWREMGAIITPVSYTHLEGGY